MLYVSYSNEDWSLITHSQWGTDVGVGPVDNFSHNSRRVGTSSSTLVWQSLSHLITCFNVLSATRHVVNLNYLTYGQGRLALLDSWNTTITAFNYERSLRGLDRPKAGWPSEPSLRSLIQNMGSQSGWSTRQTESQAPVGSSIYTISRKRGGVKGDQVGACVSHKLLKHMDWHSLHSEYWSSHWHQGLHWSCQWSGSMGKWEDTWGRPRFVSPWHV